MSHRTDDLNRVARWLDTEWSDHQVSQFLRFEEWLGSEAIPAGGIGPAEGKRLFDRHIADSLSFLRLVRDQAAQLLDVGSGVGLPGIPIAIARPNICVTIVDRAERRTRLAKRALRVLDLGNCEVLTADVRDIEQQFDAVTFRASLPIDRACDVMRVRTTPEGQGIFAWSRKRRPEAPPPSPSSLRLELVREGEGVLDSPAWLLRMRHRH